MKFLVFLFLSIFNLKIYAAESNTVIGSWLGYCDPISPAEGSRLCSYKFQKDNTGIYSCDFFSDLRCKNKTKKNFKNEFTYQIPEKQQIKITYSNDKEFEYELDRIVIDGELMRQIGLEVKKRSEKEPYKAHVGPFYFTKENKK